MACVVLFHDARSWLRASVITPQRPTSLQKFLSPVWLVPIETDSLGRECAELKSEWSLNLSSTRSEDLFPGIGSNPSSHPNNSFLFFFSFPVLRIQHLGGLGLYQRLSIVIALGALTAQLSASLAYSYQVRSISKPLLCARLLPAPFPIFPSTFSSPSTQINHHVRRQLRR